MKVIKRDNTVEYFDINKINNVLELAFNNSNTVCKDINEISTNINTEILSGDKDIEIEKIQNIVEKNLMKYQYYDTAKHYIEYRKSRNDNRLKESYINKIEDNVETPWGMLGYITYKRTYARIKDSKDDLDNNIKNTEEFRDSILRVLDASKNN